MNKLMIPVLLVSLTVIIALQQRSINEFEQRTISLESRVKHVETALDNKRAAISLLTKFVAENSRKLENYKAKRTLTVTAYSPERRQTDSTPHITASNNRVRPGIVAVSRDLFDKGWVFGKKIYIKGLGIFTIDDLMANRKRNQIDVFMGNTAKAIKFGKQQLDVYLLEEA